MVANGIRSLRAWGPGDLGVQAGVSGVDAGLRWGSVPNGVSRIWYIWYYALMVIDASADGMHTPYGVGTLIGP